MPRFLNIASYRFVPLDDLERRRRELKSRTAQAQLRGTILVSREGLNMFLAGEETPLRSFLEWLTAAPEFARLDVKESWSDHQPFSRMLVRLKREIISMGVPGIDPIRASSPKLRPRELKAWLDEGRNVTLLDVRNDYEVEVGTFAGAKAIGIDHFSNFCGAVEALPSELRQQPIVMFCTGGIRCEKAGPYMQQHGFQNVFQLDGGILKYFEECGDAHYDGDCFVFDKRVALNPQLEETGLALCFACQAVLTEADQASPSYVPAESCPHCIDKAKALPLPTIEEREAAIHAATTPLPGSIAYDNVRPIRIHLALDQTPMRRCVEQLFPGFSHAHWDDEFRLGRIRLGEMVVGGDAIAQAGQRYAHLFPNTIEPDVSADIAVLYEDDTMIVVNKPAPLPMHPSGRFNRNSLIWILRTALTLPTLRPAHRLDANTTGIVVLAKTQLFAGQLQRLFSSGAVHKTYLARCHGWPEWQRYDCDAPIAKEKTPAGGRAIATINEAQAARTEFVVNEKLADQTSIIQAHPLTGRTHQIRLHLWHLGHSIVGDPMYLAGGEIGATQTLDEEPPGAMQLHAWRLQFTHPGTGESLRFQADAPLWSKK